MNKEVYKYVFQPTVDIKEVENSLLLALVSTESIHGESQVRLDVAHYLDPDNRACVIDAATPVGRDLNRQFIGFIGREFGPDAFTVERIEKHEHRPQESAS
jgi:hypothetical protein